MRWVSLLVMVVIVWMPGFAEDSAGQAPAAGSKNLNLLKKHVVPVDVTQLRIGAGPASRRPGKYQSLQTFPPDSDPVCLTMRTYVAEREEPQSDVTRVVGSSSCQWSSKFTIKRAVIGLR
jgi:hypothetical protein